MATQAQKDAFVKAMAPVAVSVGQQYGIDPKLIIAQSGVESNWGQRAPHNVYFGVKGQGPYGGVSLMTHENVPGKGLVAMRQTFRSYPSMEAAVQDYGRLLGTSPTYAAVPNAGSLADQANALAAAGYANNGDHSAYANSIINAANSIDLSQYGMTPPANIPNLPSGAGLPSSLAAQYLTGDGGLGYGTPAPSSPPVPLAPPAPAFSLHDLNPVSAGDSLAFNPVTGDGALSLNGPNTNFPQIPSLDPATYGSVAQGAGSGLATLNALPTAGAAPPPLPAGYNALPEALRNAMLALPASSPPPVPLPRPAGYGAPPAPAAQTVTINGHPYVVGNSYQTADGATFQANANGTFSKTASTPRNPTMLQLYIQSQQPGAMANLNNTIDTAKNIGSSALGAISNIGGMLGGLFGGHSAPPTVPQSTVTGDGGWGAYMAPPATPSAPASSDNGGWAPYFASPAAPASSVDAATNGGWNAFAPSNASPGADLSSLSASIPGSTVPKYTTIATQVKIPGSDPAGDASSGVTWNDATGQFELNSSPAPAAPTYKTVYEKVLNPAYVAPQAPPPVPPDSITSRIGDAFNATPLGHIASFLQGQQPAARPGLLGLLTGALGQHSAAPQSTGGGLLGALGGTSILGPAIPSTNGYMYAPNSSGGYTNVGVSQAAANMTPAQQYQAAAQRALNSQPYGGYQASGGSSPGGSLVGGM